MQGDISIISQEGKGAEFIFKCFMPSADADFDLQQTILRNTKSLEANTGITDTSSVYNNVEGLSRASGMHLLVAEDNEINQLVIEAILQNQGITADIVSNGKKALEKVQTIAYDAVLMDCQMPIMDGYTATEEIRKIPNLKDTPIFALTADVTSEGKQKAKQSGFSGHLSKPIMVEELMSALESI